MLIDLRDVTENPALEADICVIGAGIAGLTVARRFLREKTSVVILESGGLRYDDQAQDLNEGASTGMRYYDLRDARVRFVGGTINIWGGRCAPLDAIDFQTRPWVPHSGWPITLDELEPWYKRVNEKFDLGDYAYDERTWKVLGVAPPPLDPSVVRTDFWHLSPESGYRQTRCEDIRDASNITLVLHATVTRLQAASSADALTEVRLADIHGRTGTVRAKHFVLASGGIENARLLLSSNDVEPAGIGNRHDQVGRYFMEHPHARAAEVVVSDPVKVWNLYRRRVLSNGIPVAPSLRPGEAVQEREGILNTSMTLKYQRWPDAGLAPVKLFHHWMKDNKDPDRMGLLMLRAYKKLDAWADRVLAGPVRAAQLKLKRGGLFLIARAEQAPNPASRVMLSASHRDPMGMPRVELQWNMGEIDKHSIRRFAQVIGGELRRLGLGDVKLSEWVQDESLELPYDRTVSNNPIGGYHHMGTTRMSADPRHGVVDRDCRVHGYRNLYIAGSSTFATAGWANPTFTITALAMRLGDHLAGRVNDS